MTTIAAAAPSTRPESARIQFAGVTPVVHSATSVRSAGIDAARRIFESGEVLLEARANAASAELRRMPDVAAGLTASVASGFSPTEGAAADVASDFRPTDGAAADVASGFSRTNSAITPSAAPA